ncbi:hypothetical protein [Intrasporangium sp. DVR]|uniref:hypothetical protein n=1 Tax=Intrasporangium sp. DVR TaxID=3127867 RepID=UPI00313A5469
MGLLDRNPFEASHTDALALVTFLYQTFSTRDEVVYLTTQAGVDLTHVYLEQPVALVWQTVAVQANKQGRLRVLLERVRDDPNSTQGRALIDRLLAEPIGDAVGDPGGGNGDGNGGGTEEPPPPPPPIPDAVFETALVGEDLPFIDRTHLRSSLQTMLTGQARRALLVMGEAGTGKTYTRQFIHYLGENGGPKPVKVIDMSFRAGAPIDVRELCTLIAARLVPTKETPTFDPTAQPETVVSRFVPWLADEISEKPGAVWLVLDGFTPATATGGALQLIDAVARAAANRDLGPLRVVVLGYSGNPASAGLALQEPIGSPSREDVKAFFRRAALTLQGADPGDEALEAIVDALEPIDGRPMADLGPSAMSRALQVFGVA